MPWNEGSIEKYNNSPFKEGRIWLKKHQRERGKEKRNKYLLFFFFFVVANVVNISLFCISTETQESLIPTESAYPFLWNAHGLSLLRILQKVRPKNLQKKNYLRQWEMVKFLTAQALICLKFRFESVLDQKCKFEISKINSIRMQK